VLYAATTSFEFSKSNFQIISIVIAAFFRTGQPIIEWLVGLFVPLFAGWCVAAFERLRNTLQRCGQNYDEIPQEDEDA
jgi:hypothetical protein